MAKASPKKPYHVVTVRLAPEDFSFLKELQAEQQKKAERIVPYTEILVRALKLTRAKSRARA